MGGVEHQPDAAAGENTDADDAEDKSGAGVVTESEEPFGLYAGDLSALVEGDGCFCAHGVAADEAEDEGGGTGAAHIEQGAHDGF